MTEHKGICQSRREYVGAEAQADLIPIQGQDSCQDCRRNPLWIAPDKLPSGANVSGMLLSIRKRLWTPYRACELISYTAGVQEG